MTCKQDGRAYAETPAHLSYWMSDELIEAILLGQDKSDREIIKDAAAEIEYACVELLKE